MAGERACGSVSVGAADSGSAADVFDCGAVESVVAASGARASARSHLRFSIARFRVDVSALKVADFQHFAVVRAGEHGVRVRVQDHPIDTVRHKMFAKL